MTMTRIEAIDVLAARAAGSIEHAYEGECPYESDTKARDPDCKVCQALVALAASSVDSLLHEAREVLKAAGWDITADALRPEPESTEDAIRSVCMRLDPFRRKPAQHAALRALCALYMAITESQP